VSEECVDIRDLRDGGFLWLDKEALNLASRETGNNGVVVYSWLCYYANSKAQDCFPSVTTLSKRSHVSRRTVIRHLKSLEELGLISIQRIKGKSNIYRLLDVERAVNKTGDKGVTSDTQGTGVVPVVSPPVVTPGTLEQELIKQDLFNKTEAIASVFSKPVNNLPYSPPEPEDLKRLKELCAELLPKIDLAKFISVYAKDRGYPPPVEVMIKLCERFKQDSARIKSPWGWFKTAVKGESAKFFADLNVKEHQKYKENRT